MTSLTTKFITTTALALGLSACATVRSGPLDMPTGSPMSIEPGITYFLPQQLVRVSAVRSNNTVAKKAKALADAEAALQQERTGLLTAETVLDERRREYLNSTATGERLRQLLALVAAAEARVANAESRVALAIDARDAAATALRAAIGHPDPDPAPPPAAAAAPAAAAPAAAADGTAQVTVSALKGQDVEVSLSLLPPSADTDFAFRLIPSHSIFRDYEHSFVVGRNGLLTSTNIVSADRTADVLVELATFAGAVSGGEGFSEGDPPPPPIDCANEPSELDLVLDFSNRDEIADLNRQLECFGIQFVHSETENPHWGASYTRASILPGDEDPRDGIMYRTPVDVIVEMQRCSDEATMCHGDTGVRGWRTVQTFILSLPQAGPIGYAEQDAGLLTRTSYELEFDNGILTSYESNRPGEALEFARLPMRVIGGVFDGVGQMFTSRTTLAQQQLAYENAISQLANAGLVNDTQRNTLLLNLQNSEGALERGELVNNTQMLAAMFADQTAQQNLALGGVNNQTAMFNALLAQQNAQGVLARSDAANRTLMLNALLAQVTASNQLALAEANGPAQIAQAQLQAMITQSLAELRAAELTECIAEQQSLPEGDVEVCLTPPAS